MCATLVYVKKRNVTLALPEDLLRRVKVLAAVQETSISALLVLSLEKLLLEESADYDRAMGQLLDNMKKGYPLAIGDKPSWTRESLHERR